MREYVELYNYVVALKALNPVAKAKAVAVAGNNLHKIHVIPIMIIKCVFVNKYEAVIRSFSAFRIHSLATIKTPLFFGIQQFPLQHSWTFKSANNLLTSLEIIRCRNYNIFSNGNFIQSNNFTI